MGLINFLNNEVQLVIITIKQEIVNKLTNIKSHKLIKWVVQDPQQHNTSQYMSSIKISNESGHTMSDIKIVSCISEKRSGGWHSATHWSTVDVVTGQNVFNTETFNIVGPVAHLADHAE